MGLLKSTLWWIHFLPKRVSSFLLFPDLYCSFPHPISWPSQVEGSPKLHADEAGDR